MKKLFLSFVFFSVFQFVNSQNESASIKLPIAYVNIDTLLSNYQFAKETNENLIRKQEESRLTINTSARQLQNEMSVFQKKLENNEFQSREVAEKEQNRLTLKQKSLQDLDGKLSQELTQLQKKTSIELRDSIKSFLLKFNKIMKYEIIFSNTSGDNILFANKTYDITDIVLKSLNDLYVNNKRQWNVNNFKDFWGFKFGDEKDYINGELSKIKNIKYIGYDRIGEQMNVENASAFKLTFDSLCLKFKDKKLYMGSLTKIYNIENKTFIQRDFDSLVKSICNTNGLGEKTLIRKDKTLMKIWHFTENSNRSIQISTNNINTKFGRITTIKIEYF